MIKCLSRRKVDTKKWDAVVASSEFETIYPYSWFLDSCAQNWMALVMNDYECIMPVVLKNKFGFKYSYQPVHCQQCGVYSEKNVDPEITRMFLHALNKQIRLGDYAFSEGNLLGDEPGFEVTDNVNYVLPLDKPYEELVKNYTENCRRNVKKSYQADVRFTDEIPIEEVIALKKMSDPLGRGDGYYAYAGKLFTKLREMDHLTIYGVKRKDHLLSAGLFAHSEKRAILLISASSERGKDLRGMFRVVDTFIQRHTGTDMLLDFEGSNISSIARFFRGFGAKPRLYQRISFDNSASKLVKLLRRE